MKIAININLKAIPKDLIKRVGDNAYINLNIGELKQTDERGNNLYVSVFVPQDKRDQYKDRIFIGRGRAFTDAPKDPDEDTKQANAEFVDQDHDLPF